MHQTELNDLSCQKFRLNFIFLRIYGFDSRKAQDLCLFPETCRPNVGPSQPLIAWVPGALYRAEKRSKRETNHLTPSNAEIKTAMSYIYVLMARTGTNVPVVLMGKRLVPKESLSRSTKPTLKGKSGVLKHST
jgi:hypothetical protein